MYDAGYVFDFSTFNFESGVALSTLVALDSHFRWNCVNHGFLTVENDFVIDGIHKWLILDESRNYNEYSETDE